MLPEITEQDHIKNTFYAKLESMKKEIEPKLREETEKAMASITPFEHLEKELERETRLIQLRIEAIKKLDSAKSLDTVETEYHKAINELETVFIDNFSFLLKAREYIYDNGKLIALNELERRSQLENFRTRIKKQIDRYRKQGIDRSSKDELVGLNEKLAEVEEFHACVFEKKTLLGQEFLDREHYLHRDLQTLMVKMDSELHTIHQLIDASSRGQEEIVTSMINKVPRNKRKAFVDQLDSNGFAAIHAACYKGHLKTVAALIAAGANLNIKSNFGFYPIHYAAGGINPNSIQILDLLVTNGADKFKKGDYARTALHTAAHFGNNKVIERLVTYYGLDVNAKEIEPCCYTPLHSAARKDFGETVTLLLRLGANPLLTNSLGETALYEAISRGCLSTANAFHKANIHLKNEDQLKILKEKNAGKKPWLTYCIFIKEFSSTGLAINMDTKATNNKRKDQTLTMIKNLSYLWQEDSQNSLSDSSNSSNEAITSTPVTTTIEATLVSASSTTAMGRRRTQEDEPSSLTRNDTGVTVASKVVRVKDPDDDVLSMSPKNPKYTDIRHQELGGQNSFFNPKASSSEVKNNSRTNTATSSKEPLNR